MDFPATTERVTRHSPADANRDIAEQTEARVEHYARHREGISSRLAELDREWDIERTLEANAASATLLGVLLAGAVDRRFLVLPGIVAGFLLQHALQGWCPPLPIFRRMGVRTQSEIERERYALKALRGDFALSGNADDAATALSAVRS